MCETLSVMRVKVGSMSSVRKVPELVRTWGGISAYRGHGRTREAARGAAGSGVLPLEPREVGGGEPRRTELKTPAPVEASTTELASRLALSGRATGRHSSSGDQELESPPSGRWQ